MPKITGKRPPEWEDEDVLLHGEGLPWEPKGRTIKALAHGPLLIYETQVQRYRTPDIPAWTLGHRHTSLSIVRSNSKDDLMKIGTLLALYCLEPFQHKTKGAVLRRMPKLWYDWLRECWKVGKYLEAPKLTTES